MGKHEKIIDAVVINRNCEGTSMTEQILKDLCKWVLENSNKPLSKEQKELLKHAIDSSKTIEELFTTAIISNLIS